MFAQYIPTTLTTRLKSLTSVFIMGSVFLSPVMAIPAASAQVTHGIAATINDEVVTTHDLRQRVLFNIMASGVKPDEATLERMQLQALRSLVDESLQMQEANKFDLKVGDAEVEQSVARLAQSNNLSVEQIANQMAKMGINLNTLRDQVRAEAAWQRIINGRYGSKIRVSESQIDETLNRISANLSKPNYLVSEIFIEASPDIGGMDGAMEGAAAMVKQIAEGAPLTALARQFSSAATAAKGGDVGWISEGELRSEIDAAIKTMSPGEVSDPITVPGGVYVISLRNKRESESESVYTLKQIRLIAEDDAAVVSAKTSLASLQGSLTSCDNVDTAIEEVNDASAADMGEIKDSEMSQNIRDVVSATNVGELSDPIELSGGVMALMVCNREVRGAGIPTRDQIENRMIDQQLAQQSKRYLRDLRRSATIEAR